VLKVNYVGYIFTVYFANVGFELNTMYTRYVHKNDFNYLVSKVGSTNEEDINKLDISLPKDEKIDGNDVATWVFLYNKLYGNE